jgi:uncharacterized glyoxalase superfamily protein PhnB
MAGKVSPIPPGFHSLTAQLTVRDGKAALEFYKKAFGAEVKNVHYAPSGKIMHALLKIGDSSLMLADEFPDWGVLSPKGFGGTAATINLYVEDVDAVFNQAVAAGAEVKMPIADQFWGDRYGQVEDPSGHKWAIATRKEELSEEELMRRAQEAMAEMPGGSQL